MAAGFPTPTRGISPMPTGEPDAHQRVRDLHNTLININDSLHWANVTIRDQAFTLKSALNKIQQTFETLNEQRETINGEMRRLYAAVGMEYDEVSELPGMERAAAIAERKKGKNGW